MTMKPILTSMLAAIMICVTSPALAQEASSPEDAEFNALLARAVEAYNAQRFEQAIADFQRAYEMRPEPEIVYNIARVYERSLQREQAVEQYERFLSLPNTTADLRARAATSLESLRTELAVMNRAQQAASTANANTGDQGTTGTVPPPPPPRPRPAGAVVAGWVLVGFGGASLIAGVAMGALALTEQADTEQAASLADQTEHFDLGTSYALAADILFAAGGALAIGGIIALVVHAVRHRGSAEDDDDNPSPEEEEASVSFSPLFLGQDGLGLSLGGHF